jgi:uncharacterized protein
MRWSEAAPHSRREGLAGGGAARAHHRRGDIEEFAGRVADEWQLGRKGVDDGVLFVVSHAGAQDAHPHRPRRAGHAHDALSKRIVADIVAPASARRLSPAASRRGVDAIMKAIEGEGCPRRAPPSSRHDVGSRLLRNFLFLGFFLSRSWHRAARHVRALLGAGATSALAGVAAWLVFGSIAFGVVAAVSRSLFTLFSGAARARAHRGGWGGGTFPSGGGRLGRWRRRAGGFSGGGGGFDGGGASGSW